MATKPTRTESGKWHCQVTYYDKDGRRRRKSFTAEKQRDVANLAKQFEAELERLADPCQMTVGEIIDLFIDRKRHLLSPTTIRGYEVMRKNSFPELMDVRIGNVTDEILNQAIKEEMFRPVAFRTKAEPKPRSPKSIRNAYALVSSALKLQMPDKKFHVDLPRKIRRIRDLPSPVDVYAAVKGTDLELPVLLSLWLTFSLSEIRGLTKSKSVNDDYITVREVVVDVGGSSHPVRKELAKTDTRIRRHVLPPYLKKLIDEVPGDVICPMNQSYILKKLHRLLEANGIDPISFHDIRHLSASVMAELRIPDTVAQSRGGWASDHVMKGVYQEVLPEGRLAADNKINEYFDNMLNSV